MARKSPPSAEHREWTGTEVETHAHKALAAALVYFRIPDHWEVVLSLSGGDGDNRGEIHMDQVYLRGSITLNTEHLRASPRKVWEVVGHEVAHLALAPYDVMWDGLPDKLQGKQRGAYTRATENVVVQLTRMWLRDNPDPAFA